MAHDSAGEGRYRGGARVYKALAGEDFFSSGFAGFCRLEAIRDFGFFAQCSASPVVHGLQGRSWALVDKIVFNSWCKLSAGYFAQKISKKTLLPLHLVLDGQFLTF
ncbi:hypothetical protein [Pseudomonas chlororaphis]|uniref:hypothetical protein n=1 Tax=Pseudomonas chlororaphis TaxID=587753 RepID=UPI000F579C59|nr:hypothetical protein [Pseudomonas chlororaphis]